MTNLPFPRGWHLVLMYASVDANCAVPEEGLRASCLFATRHWATRMICEDKPQLARGFSPKAATLDGRSKGWLPGWILVLYEYARWHFSISVPGRAIECSHQWGYWGGNFGIEMLDFYLHPKFSSGTVILYWYSTVSTLILVCFTSALRTQTFQGPAIDRYGRVGLKRGWACRDTMRESCRVRLTCCLVCTV